MFLMALICRLYGEKDRSKFSKAWMPLAYTLAISISIFNWGAIISKQLSTRIGQVQKPKPGEVPFFFMASYLLDVMCARNIFPGMGLSWHVSELHVHVYILALCD
jgi:hypothetical protein